MTVLLAPDPDGIAEAARLLRAGALVAFGTETVYGLGADATNPAAIASVFEAKGRPRFNPLICHYPDADAALRHVAPGTAARLLAARFWPGPLTLVLPRAADCPIAPLASAGLDTLAVRVPWPAAARSLLAQVGRPVAAPSANRSGAVSPTSARHVLTDLAGRIEAVLDSGPCRVGVESTVLDLTGEGPALLRPGGVPLEAIEAAIGPVRRGSSPEHPSGPLRSPGLMASHYAPILPVRLDAVSVGRDEALLAYGPALAGAGALFNLSAASDVVEAASRLFEGLRWLDDEGFRLGLKGIAVMPVSATGLGLAIVDRLRRAAVSQ